MITPTITTIFTVGYLLTTLWLCRGLKLNAKNLALGGIICAATVVLATIYIPLPTGSAITAGSWIPLMLLALVYDCRLSFVAGWVAGILVSVLLPLWQPVHWAQIFVENLIAFSCLGYAGIFGGGKRTKILAGCLLAIVLRFTAQVLSGVIFFSDNAWDGWGAWGYSITYHLSSKIPEGAATTAIILALPLKTLKQTVKGEGM